MSWGEYEEGDDTEMLLRRLHAPQPMRLQAKAEEQRLLTVKSSPSAGRLLRHRDAGDLLPLWDERQKINGAPEHHRAWMRRIEENQPKLRVGFPPHPASETDRGPTMSTHDPLAPLRPAPSGRGPTMLMQIHFALVHPAPDGRGPTLKSMKLHPKLEE